MGERCSMICNWTQLLMKEFKSVKKKYCNFVSLSKKGIILFYKTPIVDDWVNTKNLKLHGI